MISNYIKCCHNCEEREVGCHSWCKEYKEKRADLDELKKEIYKQKMIEDSVNSQLIESRVKCIKRKRGSR